MWPVACGRAVKGRETSASRTAWTPDLPRLLASIVRGNGQKQEVGGGCGRWDLFLKAYKRVWPVCQKLETDFSYHLPPTPHLPAKPANRAHAASLSHGWVCGSVARELLAMPEPKVRFLIHGQPTSHPLHPTSRQNPLRLLRNHLPEGRVFEKSSGKNEAVTML